VNLRLKSYHKEFGHSYAYGVSATLELLAARPEHALGVVLSSRGGRNAGIARLRDLCARHRVRVETSDRVLERLSPKDNHLAIGVFRKYGSRVDPSQNHVMLVNPADMGNVGTIVRTMVGFGFANLVLIRPAADIFDPKTIRASVGAVFRIDDFNDCPWVGTHNLYPFMTNGRMAIDQVRFESPFALVFGNESRGLPDAFLDVGTSVAIPHCARVDSLNLSVAAAIALYEGAKSTIAIR
jgi:TrmH family RNA methyltransferase